MKLPGMNAKDLKYFKEADYVSLTKAAIDYADGIVVCTEKLHPEIEAHLQTVKKPILTYPEQVHYAQACNAFYDTILEKQ